MIKYFKPSIEYYYKSKAMFQIKMPLEYHDRWSKKSIFNIGAFTKFGIDNKIEPVIPLMDIDKKAKLADVLSGEIFGDLIRGITINKKIVNELQLFNIPIFKLYNLQLSQNNNLITDYFRFVIFDTSVSYINFQKSSFTFYENIFDKKNGIHIEVNSFKDLEKYFKIKTMETLNNDIAVNNIVFNKSFSFDIFNLYYFGGYFVSEKFKNFFEEAGFTGMRFEEAPNIIREE